MHASYRTLTFHPSPTSQWSSLRVGGADCSLFNGFFEKIYQIPEFCPPKMPPPPEEVHLLVFQDVTKNS